MNKINEILKNEKHVRMIIGFGMAGMVLIMLSSFLAPRAEKTMVEEASTAQQWVTSTENQLSSILSSIKGVGTTKVMITIEEGTQQVFAKDKKNSTDETISMNDGTQKTQRKQDEEEKHIYVDHGADKQALLIKEIQPKVKGVIVVCQGAQSPVIQGIVTQAVKTSLGVGASQICVARFNDESKKIQIFK